MIDTTFITAANNIVGPSSILTDEPMSRHTTFRVGGPADYFISPSSPEEVRGLIRLCKEADEPYFVCGNGSNLLVSDEGFRGVVIHIGKALGGIEVNGETITAGAGAVLAHIAGVAAEHELTGFEFAGGIPGTLGGACVMNAGAYGGEMRQVLTSALVLNEQNDLETLSNEQLCLGYRTSIFASRPLIALSATIQLEKGDPAEIAAKAEEFRESRSSKQPLDLPSAGSTFKRPEGYFAGKLIMDAGLRGYRVGGASVSTKHCGFVVNDAGATASDIIRLICDVRAKVFEQFGVMLEPEVRFLGLPRGQEPWLTQR